MKTTVQNLKSKVGDLLENLWNENKNPAEIWKSVKWEQEEPIGTQRKSVENLNGSS